ncbi:MAG: hypothetical protein K2G33_04465, partial [Duncaniella sp.]|nr:hypothetical protein [Duncaniella sp.]
FYTLNGSKDTTVLFCGDRWAEFAGNGLGYNQWMPLLFTGSEPHLNSLSSWELDAESGAWRVAADNNYVKNGSFEADRRTVPLAVKPRQDAMTGWETTVISGNKVGVDYPDSPQLNYFNTEDDRKVVIGEKSLNISDKVPFERRVSQVVESDSFVKVPDGTYTLSAMVKRTAGFGILDMYAASSGKVFSVGLSDAASDWTPVKLEWILVSDGRVEVGFHAAGEAGASCQVDDVVLQRMGE